MGLKENHLRAVWSAEESVRAGKNSHENIITPTGLVSAEVILRSKLNHAVSGE